jgi:aspartate-semialdehyde dehydrogenase
VLKPLDNAFKLKRVVVSTYQSVSGAGNKGVMALTKEIKEPEIKAEGSIFPHRIAYNAIPQVDVFLDDAYTKEEHKMINESRKIIGIKGLNITATCVRIPSLIGHGESVNIEFEKKFTTNEIKEILEDSKGIKVIDEPKKLRYPMPIDSKEKDEVFVGRIRYDNSCKNCINLWIVSDNLRKGAATNVVQIAEELIKGK